jgi:mannonate dehydratase
LVAATVFWRVALLVATTSTFGIAAPCWSRTIPVIVAVGDCARAQAAETRETQTELHAPIITDPPLRSIIGGTMSISRRNLLQLPLAAGLATAAPRKDEHAPDNTKIATLINVLKATDDDLLFLKQIGLRWIHADFGGEVAYDVIKGVQDRLAKYGIKIHCAFVDTYRSIRLQLGQPGRDEDIEKFQTFLRNLGRAGIYSSKIDFHPGNTYTTQMIESPRGYRAREFSVDEFHSKTEKQRYERTYSAEDIWANYAYFIKAVLPVAEKADVRLALHPDDPPIPMMNGVAKVFVHYDGIRRADQIAGFSKHWGLTFCVGTWSEGGTKMGKDVYGMIEDFGARGKIFAVHFRNVSSPLPKFHETFHDDGYLDMYQVMKALRKVKCGASLIPDHYPGLVGDTRRRIAEAYSIAYMRALLHRANEEVG